jgi:hypothetical protein
MGAYEKCVKRNGKTYCWNTENGCVDKITVRHLGLAECPESILVDLMRLLNGETPMDAKKGA